MADYTDFVWFADILEVCIMEVDVINVFWTFIGLLIWPQLVLCIILWSLGHPILGVLALLTTFGSATTIVKEKYIDNNGNVVKTREYEE